MIKKSDVIVFDIDGTLCEVKREGQEYVDLKPITSMVKKLIEKKNSGYYIILQSARQMRTHNGNVGKIYAKTMKDLFYWLDMHGIPYDEVHLGKPWCGMGGYYVDDRAIRPIEFLENNETGIMNLLASDKNRLMEAK